MSSPKERLWPCRRYSKCCPRSTGSTSGPRSQRSSRARAASAPMSACWRRTISWKDRALSARSANRSGRDAEMAEQPAAKTILVDRKGGVAWVTISRPEVHHALDTHTVRQLESALREVAADADV